MARKKQKLYGKKATTEDIALEIQNLLYAKSNRPYPLNFEYEVFKHYYHKGIFARAGIIIHLIDHLRENLKKENRQTQHQEIRLNDNEVVAVLQISIISHISRLGLYKSFFLRYKITCISKSSVIISLYCVTNVIQFINIQNIFTFLF